MEVADPAHPTFLGQAGSEQVLAVSPAPDFVHGASSRGLEIFDVTTPSTPVPFAPQTSASSANALASDGSVLVVSRGTLGIQTFDVTDPGAPSFRATVPAATFEDDRVVAFRVPFAYVTVRDSRNLAPRLDVLDCTDPAAPVPAGPSVRLTETPLAIALAGDLAYVLVNRRGVDVVDVSNPSSPLRVATIPVPSTLQDLAVDGGFAYVTARRCRPAPRAWCGIDRGAVARSGSPSPLRREGRVPSNPSSDARWMSDLDRRSFDVEATLYRLSLSRDVHARDGRVDVAFELTVMRRDTVPTATRPRSPIRSVRLSRLPPDLQGRGAGVGVPWTRERLRSDSSVRRAHAP